MTWHYQLLMRHHRYLSALSCLAASLRSSNAQAIAYALVGECVRLADEVVGSGGIKWGTLMNEGLILALFAVRPSALLCFRLPSSSILLCAEKLGISIMQNILHAGR